MSATHAPQVHDDKLLQIRDRQNAFAAQYLTRSAMMEYMATLLDCYSQLSFSWPEGRAGNKNARMA